MSYKKEFDDFEMNLEIPKHWEDTSWHNDSCPSFRNKNKGVFIDYKDPAIREYNAKRFGVFQVNKEGLHLKDLLITDDFDAVKELMK